MAVFIESYQIERDIGTGRNRHALFHPVAGVWKTKWDDAGEFNISTLEEARRALISALNEGNASNVRIIRYTVGVEDGAIKLDVVFAA